MGRDSNLLGSRWRAKIKLTSVTHHLFLNVFEAQPSVSFHSSSSHRSTISILKITFFRNEIDWIGLFILFPLNNRTHQSYQIKQKKSISTDFVAFLNFFWLLLKPNCLEIHFRSVSQMAEYKRENIFWPSHEKFNLLISWISWSKIKVMVNLQKIQRTNGEWHSKFLLLLFI